jgi:hypothetical protein
MTTSLDLVLLPLVRHAGKDRPKLPGLYTSSPPRRAARGRSSDRLFIYLSMEGNAPLSPKELDKLLDHMATQYFKMSGSSTAAMRSVAETLNELLLKRNLNSSSRGRQAIGMLAMGVVRFNHLYLLQSGSSHAYLVTVDGTRQFYDPSSTGRGLGLSRATNLRFHQSKLNQGDVLIVSPHPPMTWNTTTLRNMHGLSLGDLYRRLSRRAEGDLEAVLLLAKLGKGELRLVTPQPAQEKGESVRRNTQPLKEPRPRKSASPGEPKSEKVHQKPPSTEMQTGAVSISPAKPEQEPKPEAQPESEKAPPFENIRQTWSSVIAPRILQTGRAVGNALRKAAQATSTMFERMLPDENMFNFSGPTMAFIAVAVPLVVVAIAAAVYFQRGQGRYYQAYLLEAQQAVEQAQQFEHVGEQRIAWKAALEYLDLAESYQVTEESQSLRDVATTTLDVMDKIVRINYRPALVQGLPPSVEIKRMVISLENDLYMLDGVEGDVYRAVFTGDGFELDLEFRCGSVPTPLIVGPLVDIEVLPPGNPNSATVIGMDANGNLAQCIPAGKDQLSFPMAPPDSNWGSPQAFAMDSGDLFVLDPLTNSVWVYDGASEYRELPNFFFGDQVPSLQDVVDLTVSDGRLYLLYRDGHLTTSFYGSDDFTDPAIYQDPRDGFENSSTIGDAIFNQIQFAPPPDPSIYMLDPGAGSIYHFSLALVYQRQYHGQSSLPDKPATAFAVSHNHQVFLAIGNQIYFALLP